MSKFRVILKGIVKYNDKYLLVERWYDDRIIDPYQWEFIDGELEFGESPEEAMLRLIQEKTGISAGIEKPLYTWGFSTGQITTSGIAFLCNAQNDEIVLSEDLHNYKWIKKDEIAKSISNKAVVKDIEKSGLTSDFDLDKVKSSKKEVDNFNINELFGKQ